jgi:hypothetical protein
MSGDLSKLSMLPDSCDLDILPEVLLARADRIAEILGMDVTAILQNFLLERSSLSKVMRV